MDDNLSIIEEEMEQLSVTTDSDSGVDSVETSKPVTASRIPLKTISKPPPLPQGRSRQKMVENIMKSKVSRSHSVPASSRPPFTSFSTSPSTPGQVKKVPMNKVVVGVSPSPNLRKTSKIGSLANSSHRPGGGQVKIETRKLDWNVSARTVNVNSGYAPSGGDKKIEQRKLSWNVGSRIGSLEKAGHRPGGGQVKIENRKLDWNSVNSRVGSKKNLNHQPGGGNVEIHNEKLDFQVGSRIGSLANVKHRPGGGDKKIFDDKEYARQMNEVGGLARSGSSSLTSSTWDNTERPATSTMPRSKRSVTSPGSSFQSQIIRKLSPMSTGF